MGAPVMGPSAGIKVDLKDWLVKCDRKHLTVCAAAALTERQKKAVGLVRKACKSKQPVAFTGIPLKTINLVKRAATEARGFFREPVMSPTARGQPYGRFLARARRGSTWESWYP